MATLFSLINKHKRENGEFGRIYKKYGKVTFISEAIVSNSKGILLLKRCETNGLYLGKWQLPGGKQEKNESPLQAMKRELFEETGCKCSKIKLKKTIAFGSNFRNKPSAVVLSVFSCKLKGEVCLSRDHSMKKFVKKPKISPSSITPVSRLALFGK